MEEKTIKIINWIIIIITGLINSYRVYRIGNYGDWADLAAAFTFGALLAWLFIWGLEKGAKKIK